MTRLLWVLYFLFLFAGAIGVSGQSYLLRGKKVAARYLSPSEIADKSKALVHVRIESVAAERKNNMVYTVLKCSVLDSVDGQFENGEIEVRQPGGSLNNLHTWSGPMPAWKAGEEWVLGLSGSSPGSWAVVGIKQGAFRVNGDSAERDFDGFVFSTALPNSVKEGRERFLLEQLKLRMGWKSDEINKPADMARDEYELHESVRTVADGTEKKAVEDEGKDSGCPAAVNRLPMILLMVISSLIVVVLLLFRWRKGN